jgi:hypothetical protein
MHVRADNRELSKKALQVKVAPIGVEKSLCSVRGALEVKQFGRGVSVNFQVRQNVFFLLMYDVKAHV